MRLGEILSEGITHIEDLPVDNFISAIENLNHYSITEKIDGFNIKFGIDEDGFYTRGKPDVRRHKSSEWGDEFRYTGFKSAHEALVRVLPELLKNNAVKPGDEVEAEVLFGDRPNTVPYDDDMNRIIFLKVAKGTPDINLMKELLDGTVTDVNIETPYTTDGRSIEKEMRTHNWGFAQTPIVHKMKVTDVIQDTFIRHQLSKMRKYLNEPAGIAEFSNAEVLAVKLNKRPETVDAKDWKEVKADMKEKRAEVHDTVMSYKLDVKEQLLDKMVRSISSQFGPDIKDGGWIEGIVLHNGDEIFKIVDKDVFTSLNTFNWKVRQKLSGNPKGIKNVDSIVGKIKVAMADIIGHPELATQQKKRHAKKHELTVEEIAKDIDFKTAKSDMHKILARGERILQKYHDAYERLKDNTSHHVNFGEVARKFHIDPGMNMKNLESFAELYDIFDTLDSGLTDAKTSEDLVRAVVGDL